ncbi:sensor histidine kinase [Sphingomonas sp. Mn802worker]|uniref:sensor histidine kinase n=1 Tax=Sphingomonas sp. Mn802worker TaxID=629773 RepID=UPI000364EE81|nr:HAMP domain-containing sensor histidine kinase [Sphingomonas sp. Mn802worker]
MALLVAVALFVAQAINFTLVLRDRANFRLAQATRPVATRIADALEREQAGRVLSPDRGRVRRVRADPIPPDLPRHAEVSSALRDQLKDLGVSAGRIDTGLQPAPLHPDDRDVRLGRDGQSLLIAVEQPGRGWLSIVAPWPGGGGYIFWRLFAQTLILYAIMLAAVLWIARRISRPLRVLASAAHDFDPSIAPVAIVEDGPADVRAVTAAFNGLRLRVTAMLDEKDRMLGAIGHDLRTPLAALRVRIESVEDEQDRARMADTIAEMNRTLDDILSLARLGRPSEPVTEVDLAALVDAVVEDFRDLGANVAFEEADRLRIRLRPSLIRRAIRNLIENAIKYADGAEVTLRPAIDTVVLSVADHGPGIPADRLADVLAPFTRLETSRNRETGGIGLGLALARAIVEEAGGRIALSNRDGGGLCAEIMLPRGR